MTFSFLELYISDTVFSFPMGLNGVKERTLKPCTFLDLLFLCTPAL